MKESFGSRLQHAWNAFFNRDPTSTRWETGSTYYHRPDRVRFSGGNERSIVNAIYNRIAMDAAAIDIFHVRLDEEGRYTETIDSSLNERLNLEANIDQTGRMFKQDMYMSTLDEGAIAVIPVETDIDPKQKESYKILSVRTAKILEWAPRKVKVRLYNDRTGNKEEIWFPKDKCLILENPFYSVMNERSSTLQRLIRKLNLLDAIDEQSGSGKLDMIIQLPYTVRSDLKRQQAEERLNAIKDQLKGPYGIAYADGTERIIQLNRPVENNLMKQIEYLTSMLFSQLGMTQSILDGTADEKTMLNYYTRTIEPLVSVPVDEMKRKFLSKTARTQRQSIMYFRNPFKLVPVSDLAEVADKMTRNEIMTSNEIRQEIGLKPSKDPKADQLVNSNISQPSQQERTNPEETPFENNAEGESQNGEGV
jgi:hypothetical protein